jgi:pimeloyl-ACP methyl ester carboxylesterase
MSWMDLVHERREPIIFVHGMTQNCRCWTVRSLIYETFDSKDKDVWLANNRMADGFSDGWWRYEIEDMAMRDMPQITQKVLDVTGYEKVDIVGYSRGNALMFYALSLEEHELYSGVAYYPFQEKVNRLYAIAPCLPANLPSGVGIPFSVIGENLAVKTFLYQAADDIPCHPYWTEHYIVP